MTRDEVMAMTNEELRIRAAELLGCRVRLNPDGSLTELGEGNTRRYQDAVIPDYPNDIAGAWELAEKARENNWWWSAVYKAGYTIDDASAVGYEVVFRDVDGALRPDAYAGDVSLPSAITSAFILAMTEDGK